jgi:hypothetical protein
MQELQAGSVPELPKQHVSLIALCKALSPDRLGAYSLNSDSDSLDAIARYLWNGSLCIDFHASLHVLEVVLRNNLYRASQKHVKTKNRPLGTFKCWLTASPSLLYEREALHVQEAVARVREKYRNDKYHTPGRLIAKLGLGFWTSLCRAPYDHSRHDGPQLWPALLQPVFSHLPREHRTRSAVSAHLEEIRDFRNRIAHHEPIWDWDVLSMHNKIITAIAWMYPDVAGGVRILSEVEITYKKTHSYYRQFAARLLGIDEPAIPSPPRPLFE